MNILICDDETMMTVTNHVILAFKSNILRPNMVGVKF